jgi:hypothetical protein
MLSSYVTPCKTYLAYFVYKGSQWICLNMVEPVKN